jgi:4-amino-4-deoxy-L-arabinose transferase-like glycosyltransferase
VTEGHGARLTRRDLALLATAALVLRGIAAVLVDDPPYLDPAYYELVARRLAGGDGFTTPALWSFLEVGGRLPVEASLPVPSNGHWMPLTAVVAALSMAMLGPSRLAAELPMILAGAALVPLTALVAWELFASRRVALVSGVLALFAGPMLVLVPLVDSFAIFGLAGFCALYGATRALRDEGGGRWLLVSGLGVGLATLARVDGMLLAVAPAVAWLVRRRVGPWQVDVRPLPWSAALASAAAALVVLAPWLIRQQLVFGTPFPSAGGHTLWITSYNEQFSIGHPVDLGSYLASGPPAIIGSKLASWGLLVGRTAVLLGGAFVISFAYGLWRERRRAEVAPFLVYWWLLFVVMGGLFTFHAPQGAWYHSAWAWLPFAIPIAVGWFGPGVAALGRRWRLFARERNQRFLLNAATIGAVVLSLVGSASVVVMWRADRARVEAAATYLEAEAGPGDVVMYVDPPSLTLLTGLPSVAPPYDPYPVIEEVIRTYGVRWVVVERERGASQDALRLWDGGTAVDAQGNRADFLADAPAFAADDVRVYAVADR